MPEIQKRQVACYASISEVAGAKYVKEEGWQPNYVITKGGRKISRVNIAGVVVSPPSEEAGFTVASLDDGSGMISLRVFDNPKIMGGIMAGEPVFVVGRPRQYGNETYILAEIVKRVSDPRWIELRKLELQAAENMPQAPEISAEKTGESLPNREEEMVVEEDRIGSAADGETPAREPGIPEKVRSMIREMDSGSGADYEEIIAKAGANSDKAIKSLLLCGDIFEVSPGKLKVLE